jgi:hypothetical protein
VDGDGLCPETESRGDELSELPDVQGGLWGHKP